MGFGSSPVDFYLSLSNLSSVRSYGSFVFSSVYYLTVFPATWLLTFLGGFVRWSLKSMSISLGYVG